MTEELKNYDIALFCYENQREGTVFDVLDSKPVKNIAIIVGSEGGFSPEEAQAAVDAGATAVTLGKRILRAETAPLYVLSLTDGILGRTK